MFTLFTEALKQIQPSDTSCQSLMHRKSLLRNKHGYLR